MSKSLITQTHFVLLDPPAVPAARPFKQAVLVTEPVARRGTRNKKTKSKRARQVESSDSTESHCSHQHLRPPRLNLGLNPTCWSSSDTSQSPYAMTYPAMMPGYPLQGYPTPAHFGDNQTAQAPPCPPSIHPFPFTAPMVTPIVALVLPNYMYSAMTPGPQPPQPVYHAETGGFTTQTQPFCQAAFPGQGTFMVQPSFGVQNHFNPQNLCAPPAGYLTPSYHLPQSEEVPKGPVEAQSRPSTPQSGLGGGPASPPLFQSGCSSPLNLLELELSVDLLDNTVLPPGGQGNTAEREKGASGTPSKVRGLKQVNKEITLSLLLSSFSLLSSPCLPKRVTHILLKMSG